MAKELVQFWKGSENAYHELYIRGRIKDNVRYTVILNDGRIKEYLGYRELNNCDLEQLAAMDDVMSIDTFQRKFNSLNFKNCRLLVGDNNAFDEDGNLKDEYVPSDTDSTLWYAVVFGNDPSKPTQLIDFNEKTARIKTMGMKEYQVVDNVLMTYNSIIWHENNK